MQCLYNVNHVLVFVFSFVLVFVFVFARVVVDLLLRRQASLFVGQDRATNKKWPGTLCICIYFLFAFVLITWHICICIFVFILYLYLFCICICIDHHTSLHLYICTYLLGTGSHKEEETLAWDQGHILYLFLHYLHRQIFIYIMSIDNVIDNEKLSKGGFLYICVSICLIFGETIIVCSLQTQDCLRRRTRPGFCSAPYLSFPLAFSPL